MKQSKAGERARRERMNRAERSRARYRQPTAHEPSAVVAEVGGSPDRVPNSAFTPIFDDKNRVVAKRGFGSVYTPKYVRGGRPYLIHRTCDYFDPELSPHEINWARQPPPKPKGQLHFVNGASDRAVGGSSSKSPRVPHRKIESCECKKCQAARKRLI